jgi:hypothetical protein
MSAHEVRADLAQKSAMGGELAFSVAAAPPFSMRLASQGIRSNTFLCSALRFHTAKTLSGRSSRKVLWDRHQATHCCP